MTNSFFDSPEDHSLIKADIVVSYFGAWAKIMAPRADRILYLDLFAGPGRYASGEESTPLLLVRRALEIPGVDRKLEAVFNDADSRKVVALRSEFERFPGIERFSHQPRVLNESVGDSFAEMIEGRGGNPVLTFLDPWGYAGLTRKLIAAAVRGFGCEAVFFLNYNRINAAVSNDLVQPHMQALFGTERLDALRHHISDLRAGEREGAISRALGESLEELGIRYLMPFRFRSEGGRTSHHIWFVTKHPLAYGIMKDIMAKRGEQDADGVPRFEYFARVEGRQLPFDVDRPLTKLAPDLLKVFAGQRVTHAEVFRRHNVGLPFLKAHYRLVLMQMEQEGLIQCDPPSTARRRGTMTTDVRIVFPPSSHQPRTQA